MPGWATEGPALLFLQTSPPISHAGLRPGKCYLFLLKLTAGEILTFTVCAVVVFGGQEGRVSACVWFTWGRVGELEDICVSFLCAVPPRSAFPSDLSVGVGGGAPLLLWTLGGGVRGCWL